MKLLSEHGFGPHAEMAFYDREKERITPWFPVDTRWTGTPGTHGLVVAYVGVRDFDEFEMFTACFAIVEGATHTAVLPAYEPVFTCLRPA